MVTLFIASSLDGYIAGPDDDLSWLFTDADYGFLDFFADTQALIMGKGTYHVVRTFGDWPYPGKATYVVSRQDPVEISTPDTFSYEGELPGLLERITADGHEHVWLVGGGQLVRSFLNAKLVDRIVVSVHPVLLGTGVALFPGGFPKTRLVLENAEAYDSGLVQLTYSVAA